MMDVTTHNVVPRFETTFGADSLEPSLERVLHRIRLRAQRRVAWLRKLWSEEEAPGGNFAITHGEVDTHLLDKDSPQAEADWIAGDAAAIALTVEIDRLEAEIAADRDSRLARLHGLFGLDALDMDTLQACLAVSLDPNLRRVYAYLQDQLGRGYASEELIGRLFGTGRRSTLRTGSPLIAWRLIAVQEAPAGEPRILDCDPNIRDWLCGREELDARLQPLARTIEPLQPLENWPVAESAEILQGLIDRGLPARMVIKGPVGSGRRTLAAGIAVEHAHTLLAIDSDAIADADWPEVYLRAQRHALLNDCAIAWFGKRTCDRAWSAGCAAQAPLQFAICDPAQRPQPLEGVATRDIRMPAPSQEERLRLWHRHVPQSRDWEGPEAELLLARRGVTIGAIAEAGRTAVQTPQAAAAKIRETERRGLDDLVEAIDCPFDWEDLVLPDHVRLALEEFVFEAQARDSFWEDPRRGRLFPQGRGLFALLSGAPGVGKTMIAQVVAKALGRELYRIDVSRVVSKYVGETAKNLRRLLPAIPTDELLFFDEADALFGKRPAEAGDAHDRYAAQESSTLLMAIEGAVEGRSGFGIAPGAIGLLATNRRSEIDAAFIRRLRYVITVPQPDAAQRLQLWQRLVGELAGTDTLSSLDRSLDLLSREVETTGAQIKYAVLSAIFAAARDEELMGMKHLLHGMERELRKEGRGWSARERERLMNNGG